MECKCCGEQAEFKLVEQGTFKNRYLCGNCNKYFKADKQWLQNLKTVKKIHQGGSLIIVCGIAIYHFATGNPDKAIETVAEHFNLDGDNNDSTTA